MENATTLRSECHAAALKYAEEGWAVIPLKGKKPLTPHGYKDATKDEAQITRWWTIWPEANIGLATGAISGRLVLDIDVKNGKKGDESLRLLLQQNGELPKTRKSVTASGGWHYVFRMPAESQWGRIMRSNKGVREGIDLLANGSYFVAPPSVVDGKEYKWIDSSDVAQCPPWVAALAASGGQHKTASFDNRVSILIRELFPEGRESNGNWLTRCPFHEDEDPSFAIDMTEGMFICYSDSCKQTGSFVELYTKIKNVPEDEARRIITPPLAFVEKMNREHAVITDFGGKCIVLNESIDPAHTWKTITFSSRADLRLRYQNQMVPLGQKYVELSEAWFRNRSRREYKNIVFRPGLATPGNYNLWQSYACVPKAGDCGIIHEHAYDIICRKDEGLYRYFMSWMAQIVQQPWELLGTAIVLRGKMGTGKGVMCTQFGSLFRPHFTHATKPEHLVGRFNAHLNQAVVVFADDVYLPGEDNGALKTLITEKTMLLEYKGKDIVEVDNYIRLMIATNHDWAVPAGLEERRFCVLDVSDERRLDTSYFEAMDHKMKSGGREAFLHDLLNYDIRGMDLRKLPQTEGLIENKLLTMSTVQQFWYQILLRGTVLANDRIWTPRIKKDPLHDEFKTYAKEEGRPPKSCETILGITIKRLCPHSKPANVNGNRGWEVGALEQCRVAFDRALDWSNHDWLIPAEDSDVATANLQQPVPKESLPESRLEEYDWDRFASGEGDNGLPPEVSM